jgi:hypothetical protein
VSAKGIAADPSKIETVRQWPRPQNLTELRSYIGLCSYYRKYVPGFATIAQALHMLTNKGQRFTWGEEQETAFQTLKTRLTTAPILAPPNDEGEYVLDTDGSSADLGAVLLQRKKEELHVIAYASRCLSRAERNYNTTRRELLAVVIGLKQFRPFLLGRHFLLRVDHSSLTYLQRTPEVMGQAARWLEFIEEFNFTIQHRSGVSLGNCDALSRRPCDMEEKGEPDHPCCRRTRQTERRVADRDAESREEHRVADREAMFSGRKTDEFQDINTDAIIEAQQSDSHLRPVLEAVMKAGPRPPWTEVQSSPEDTRALWAQYKSLEMIDGILYRKFYQHNGTVERLQIVMPAKLRKPFLCQIHESKFNTGTAHMGIRKTQDHVSQRAYWPNWRFDDEQ